MYLNTGKKEECTGCTACKEICSHSAIEMVEDHEGFFYPYIDSNKCVDCGLCRKVCPVNHPSFDNDTNPKVFINSLKNTSELKKSSSGGLFYAIAEYIIENKGIVVGAYLDSNLKVVHKIVSTIKDIDDLRGSKYVQSNLRDIFIEIRHNLLRGNLVYFVGTPCQVAGLKSFLIKKYNNLITSDLICHGVPSQKMLESHINYRQKQFKHKITNILFRDNENWSVCEICYLDKCAHPKTFSYKYSPYLYPFMFGYNYRPSCYECPFAKIPRQGDITLGDFWGAKEFHPEFDTKYGASAAIINNNLGINIWNKIKHSLNWEIATVDEVAANNWNLTHYTKLPNIRKGIYDRLSELGYDKMAKRDFRMKHYISNKFLDCAIKHLKIREFKAKFKNIFK